MVTPTFVENRDKVVCTKLVLKDSIREIRNVVLVCNFPQHCLSRLLPLQQPLIKTYQQTKKTNNTEPNFTVL